MSQSESAPVSPEETKPSASTAAPAEAAPDAASQVSRLQEQLAAANDRVLRAQAEFENYRKRKQREAEESIRYGAMTLIGDLLAVLDNLQRAQDSAKQAASVEALTQGVQMVSTQFESVLEKHQCRRIAVAPGDGFDPSRHEALAHQPHAEHPSGTVSLVYRPGYQLHDRVLRPAQVLVSSGPPTAGSPTA